MTYDEWFNNELAFFGKWEWTINDFGEKVDAVVTELTNPDLIKMVQVKNIVNFFNKIDAPMLKEGNVQKLYENGATTIEAIIKESRGDLVHIIGENGNKIYDGLKKQLTDIPLYKIMGAYSTERGIGIRRLKKVQTALGRDSFYGCTDVSAIIAIDGFDTITATQVMNARDNFIDFFSDIKDYVTIEEEVEVGDSLANEKICMTGFRDKEMAANIESKGGTVQSGVSGKTTILVCKDPDSTTGKAKKARDLGIKIMGIDDFKSYLDTV